MTTHVFVDIPGMTKSSVEPLISIVNDYRHHTIIPLFFNDSPDTLKDLYANIVNLEKEEYTEAHRKRIKEAIEYIKSAGFRVIEKKGLTAADAISAAINSLKSEESFFKIYSNDFRLLQLADDHVEIITEAEAADIDPKALPLYWAITGTHLYPGIKGIGHKTAAKILKKYPEYKDFANGLKSGDKVFTPKTRSKLLQNLENINHARLYHYNIRKNLKLDFSSL